MIFVVIPAYNEEANLRSLIPKINEILVNCNLIYKILIINDGSQDCTKQISIDLARRFPIQLLDHDTNKGIGAVFNTGLMNACVQSNKNDVVVVLEADSTNDPKLIPDMVRKIFNDQYDIIIASRYQKGGYYSHFPLKRLILSKVANYVFRILYPIKNVKDYTIFFRAYRAEILKKGFTFYGDRFIDTKTFVCNAAILVRLRRFKVKVGEIPLIYRYELKKGTSKMKIRETLKEYIYFIFNIVR